MKKTLHYCKCALKTMISIYMIITSATSTALAKGFMECNLSEPTGAHQCFGAVGQPLIFNLPNTANTEIMVTKDDKYLIFKRDKNKRVTYNESGDFTNQTFKLNNATKRHSGNYQMEEHGLNGTLLKKVKVHLEIQSTKEKKAPVSEPAVSQTCLSPEQMEVSCSSEGDEVQFVLSLDGHLLMQTRTFSQSQRNWTVDTQSLTTGKQDKANISIVSISLYGQLTGNLTCRVWNNVSRDEKVIHLKSCKDCVSCFPVVTVAVISSVVTLLLHVALCVGLKHLQKKTTTITVNEDNPDKEIVYSEVRVMKNTRKT
ncbi:uncharacterized protein LOC122995085 isoform X1 [Scomber scombrus]|uniref:Uncharacterized protein LOC122995085 isoform X1 n=1 Tax=Scomber scombrus TaxID=13677 RepID=A0AAV1PYS7_SCOSC